MHMLSNKPQRSLLAEPNGIYLFLIMFCRPTVGANALSQWGPHDGLCNLYSTGERKMVFQKYRRKSGFRNLENLYPQKGRGKESH